MIKKFFCFTSILTMVCACAPISHSENADSNQKTECASLRTTILKSSMTKNQSGASAVAETEMMQAQKIYHNECE